MTGVQSLPVFTVDGIKLKGRHESSEEGYGHFNEKKRGLRKKNKNLQTI